LGFFTVPCNGLQIPLGFVIFEQDLSKSLDCIAQEYEVGASQFTFFFEAMADSLAAAHELAIVHRDVTPNNFLIRCSGSGSKAYFDEVILIDFGLAYVPGFQDVCLDTTTGTPGFAAPEIASGRTLTKPETYQRSDAFGLAATAYFLLYGHTPPSEEDHWAMVRNETRYPSITYGTQRRRVSLGVDIALQRGLSRNPMWRPKVSNLSSDLLRAYHQEG
jgi:serine/threonine protein kinase